MRGPQTGPFPCRPLRIGHSAPGLAVGCSCLPWLLWGYSLPCSDCACLVMFSNYSIFWRKRY